MRETLPEEPPASDDVAAVRFQLPQGIKLARRFHKSHTVKVIIITICRIFLSLFFCEKLFIEILYSYDTIC